MRPIPAVLALLTLVHPGCGENASRTEAGDGYTVEMAVPEAPSAPAPVAADIDFAHRRYYARSDAEGPMMAGAMMGMMGGVPGGEPPQEAPPPQDAPPPGAELARKIIYDAQIELVVEELDPAAERLVALVQQHAGYIAEQDLSGAPGTRRTGRWKLRVPVDRFEGFVGELLGLGELVRNQRTSQDVTEQFYDIEARIRNKRVEEQTILKILEERSGALEDVLKVQVELSRVRGEIEQMEGRLRVLENLSGLATITLTLREREDYAPAAPVAPDFRTRVARAWSGSITDLRTAGEDLAIFAVGLAPRLPFLLLGLAAAILLVRFLWRRFVRALPRLVAVARRPIGLPRGPGEAPGPGPR